MVWLLDPMGGYLSISFYLLVMCAIAFTSVYLVTETYAVGAGEALAT